MALCNLFKKLEKPTGNFLMFSQYVEDITKMYTQPGQMRVTPSRFVALNIDYSNFNHVDFMSSNLEWIEEVIGKYRDENGNVDYNVLIPTYLQNYFENGCAFLRTAVEENAQEGAEDNLPMDYWNPELSKHMLWNYLYTSGLIGVVAMNENGEPVDLDADGRPIDENEVKYYTIPEVMYYDDINIQSYNEYAGMGYNEIYCYIPNEGKRKIIKVNEPDLNVESYDYNKMTIMGYETPKDGMLDIYDIPDSYYADAIITPADTNENPSPYALVEDGAENEFDFNTIVVMYNTYVINEDNGTYDLQYQDIPMGIYFTGIINNVEVIDEESNMIKVAAGSVTNTTTKYISNPDIFGAGTSYGLRLCNRFIVSPNSDYVRVEAPEISKDPYSTVAQLLSEMGTTLSKMNDVINNQNQNMLYVKESLAQIKNRQVNVPYAKNINGRYYWFVNGKNTHIPVECTPYESEYIDKSIEAWEKDTSEITLE